MDASANKHAMDIYKEFLYRLRNYNLQDVYLFLHEDLSPKLKEYICLLRDVPFEDGLYHTYYADVKKVVSTFMNYFIQTIDEVTLEVDKYTNVLCKDDLINLMEKTVSIHEKNQIDFAKDFLPIKAPIEKQIYEEIESKYDIFKCKLKEFQSKLEQLNKKEQIDEFAKSNHFQFSLKKSSDLFHFVHIFIGMMVADRLYQIRVSLEEILLRVRSNLQLMRDEEEEVLNGLLNELYDKNKEQLFINRSYKRYSMEEAEVSVVVRKGIEIMQEKIENRETNVHISRLEQEVSFWEKRITDFNQCADLLTKLKTEFDTIVKEEDVYNNLRINEKPGPKLECWKNMGNNYKERKQYLNMKIADAAKALLTFFSCRGTNRIYYTDNVGPYYVDEYNHKVYYFNYGLDMYHTDCDGKFKEIQKQAYYHDLSGRYTLENGNKIYQCAPCTSKYVLDENELFKKITQDCGHSEKANEKCRLDFKDTVEEPPVHENAVNS
uniref:Uncharacterized protein n=1 Tax=Bombyx mori TaxID=7091 RepID=A0A8R2R902_BOMMO|nr:uncharacterized protein LOC110384865 isoform X3 [Bombyx mori]